MKSMKTSGQCRRFINKDFQFIYGGVLKARPITLIHQLGFVRAISWSAHNAESHWSHVHITLIVENISFHAFYEVWFTARFEVFFKLHNVVKTINIFLAHFRSL